MPKWNEYRVKCNVCGWTGIRHARDCECYEDWSMYCRPWTPGPGCPSWVTYPCPQRHLRPGLNRDYLYQTSDSPVIVIRKPEGS